MKILVDENLDEQFVEFLPGHDARHVNAMGWQGTKNGELMSRLETHGFEVLITADKGMSHQNKLEGRAFALILLDIHPNVLVNQAACVGEIEARLSDCERGKMYLVKGPHPKRERN